VLLIRLLSLPYSFLSHFLLLLHEPFLKFFSFSFFEGLYINEAFAEFRNSFLIVLDCPKDIFIFFLSFLAYLIQMSLCLCLWIVDYLVLKYLENLLNLGLIFKLNLPNKFLLISHLVYYLLQLIMLVKVLYSLFQTEPLDPSQVVTT